MPASTIGVEVNGINAMKRPSSSNGVSVPAKLCKKAEDSTNGEASKPTLNKEQIMDIRQKHIG